MSAEPPLAESDSLDSLLRSLDDALEDGAAEAAAAPEQPAEKKEEEEEEPEAKANWPPPLKSIHQSRVDMFQLALEQQKIERELVAKHAFTFGVPERPGMRSLVWKLLLGYLPFRRADWEADLARNRQLYTSFVADLVVNPYKKLHPEEAAAAAAAAGEDGAAGGVPRSESSTSGHRKLEAVPVAAIDDPLGAHQGSEWAQFFADEEVRAEIRKDIERTYADFHFFNLDVNPPARDDDDDAASSASSSSSSSLAAAAAAAAEEAAEGAAAGGARPRVRRSHVRVNSCPDDKHSDVLLRILFVFARLNPGIRYVQGMNEVLAPMYYVYASDPKEEWREHAEADAFFCFCNVMADLRDRFIKSLDSTTSGILAVVRDLNELLRLCDPELWSHLEALGIDPRFYSFRWLTTNLAQEFELPDLLRIWDSLFADDERFTFQLYVCVAMLVCARDTLLRSEFAVCIQTLQNYPPEIDVQTILARAARLRDEFRGRAVKTDPQNDAGRVQLRADVGRKPRMTARGRRGRQD